MLIPESSLTPLTGKRPPIETMIQQVNAIDAAPWRAEYDHDGSLIIWFHANLAAEPRRIIISECLGPDGQPSPNELAAAGFLVQSREYVRQLAAYAAQLEAELFDMRRSGRCKD